MRRRRPGDILLTLFLAGAAPLAATTAADVGGCAGTVPERVLAADPGNYLAQVAGFEPGDLLRLAPGTYTQGLSFFDHHVTLENLYIHGHGRDQQVVGINTKCPAWNWVIRRNTISGKVTG